MYSLIDELENETNKRNAQAFKRLTGKDDGGMVIFGVVLNANGTFTIVKEKGSEPDLPRELSFDAGVIIWGDFSKADVNEKYEDTFVGQLADYVMFEYATHRGFQEYCNKLYKKYYWEVTPDAAENEKELAEFVSEDKAFTEKQIDLIYTKPIKEKGKLNRKQKVK